MPNIALLQVPSRGSPRQMKENVMHSRSTRTWLAVAAVSISSASLAQQPAAPAAAPAAPAAASISQSLGVVVFPSKNQTAAQQSSDEGYCYGWAKTQSGIDPMSIKPAAAAPAATPDPNTAGQGDRARGAVRGAALGTAVGAIAGDTGKGAAIGAVTGVAAGGSSRRQAKQAAATQQQQAQAQADQQAQASIDQQKAAYNKTFATCMEGKGYSAR
ncbi:MAG: glycine zipper family protein [Proteobacteria bacterium]|nr:glycine zipper family protein [Pseudomonadota bacterium]